MSRIPCNGAWADPFKMAAPPAEPPTPDEPLVSVIPVAPPKPAEPATRVDVADLSPAEVPCPNCQHPIVFANEAREVGCAACGSSFRVRDAQYLAWEASQPPSIATAEPEESIRPREIRSTAFPVMSGLALLGLVAALVAVGMAFLEARESLGREQIERKKAERFAKDVELLQKKTAKDARDLEVQFEALLAWDQVRNAGGRLEIALVPVHVEDFAARVKPPTDQELKTLFEERKALDWDPTAERCGFKVPQRIKVEWLARDPATSHEAGLSAMKKARAELANIKDSRKERLPAKVAELVKQGGLKHHATTSYADRFTVATAPELMPLHKAFLRYYRSVNLFEGREEPGAVLTKEQFFKMFFSTEEFAVGSDSYLPRPWPPDVAAKSKAAESAEKKKPIKLSLFDTAQEPILFWKTEELPALVPERMDEETRRRVEHVWRLEKARQTAALAKAGEIAYALLKTSIMDLRNSAKVQARGVGRDELIVEVARKRPDGGVSELAIGNDPPPDLHEQLLALEDLKTPLCIGEKTLDALNRKLAAENSLVKVQVLTNQPRNVLYVAVMCSPSLRSVHEGWSKLSPEEKTRFLEDAKALQKWNKR